MNLALDVVRFFTHGRQSCVDSAKAQPDMSGKERQMSPIDRLECLWDS